MVVKKEMMGSNFGGVEFEVERYDGWTDYLLWEKQVKGVLRAMGLDYLLLTQEEYDGDEEISEKRWRQEQVMAVNVVMLYLKPHIIKKLDVYEDCQSLFTALKEKYYRDDNSDRLHKKFMLMGLRMKEGGKLHDHLDEFDSIVIDLVNLKKEVSDEDKALLLLNSLPPSYQALKQVLIYPDLITISYDEVVRFLLSNDAHKRLLQFQPASSSGTALSVNRERPHQRMIGHDRFRSKSRSALRGKSQERKPLVCWKCSKPGHMKKDCPEN